MYRVRAGALIATVAAVLATGCGSSSPSSATGASDGRIPPPGSAAEGKRTFASVGCGACHTFAAAGSHGTVGTNLDDSALGYRSAFVVVRDGRGNMTGFGSRLSDRQIAAVAEFVVAERRR